MSEQGIQRTKVSLTALCIPATAQPQPPRANQGWEVQPAADAAETPSLELTTTSTSDPGRKGRATGTSSLQKQRDYGRGVFSLGTGRATGL